MNSKNKRQEILFHIVRFLKLVAFFLFLYAIYDVFRGDFLQAGLEFLIALLLYFGLPYLWMNFLIRSAIKEAKNVHDS